MTPEEYKEKLEKLKTDFEINKRNLAKEYAFSHNTYKIGDVITNGVNCIKIDKIKYSMGRFGSLPECVYEGPLLKKDLTERKDKQLGCVYYSHIKDK